MIEKVNFKSNGNILIWEIELPKRIPAPAVILFHGLSNSRRDCPLIEETAKALVKEEFIVFRFDFYGSGESPGQMQDKLMGVLEKNAKDAIDFIAKDSRVSSIGLWGRSLGGTFVCLIPPNSRIKARVSASGGSLIERIMKTKFEEIKKKEIELEKQGKRLPGTGNYKGPFNFKKEWFKSLRGLDKRVEDNLKKIHRILVLGTSRDTKVTLDNACQIINNANDPRKIYIFDADHDYAGYEEEAVQVAVNWFKTYLK